MAIKLITLSAWAKKNGFSRQWASTLARKGRLPVRMAAGHPVVAENLVPPERAYRGPRAPGSFNGITQQAAAKAKKKAARVPEKVKRRIKPKVRRKKAAAGDAFEF